MNLVKWGPKGVLTKRYGGFSIQTSLLYIYLSRLYAQASMHSYDAATGIFSTTLKIDWVTRKVRHNVDNIICGVW